MAKRGQALTGLGQAPLSPVLPGRRVGDEQNALGSHGRRSTHLADPVASNSLQVAVAVGLRGVRRKVDLLKITNGAPQLVTMRGFQRLWWGGIDAMQQIDDGERRANIRHLINRCRGLAVVAPGQAPSANANQQ